MLKIYSTKSVQMRCILNLWKL